MEAVATVATPAPGQSPGRVGWLTVRVLQPASAVKSREVAASVLATAKTQVQGLRRSNAALARVWYWVCHIRCGAETQASFFDGVRWWRTKAMLQRTQWD